MTRKYKALHTACQSLVISTLVAASSFSQIPDNLFNNLPDSLKPQQKSKPAFSEINKILKYAFGYSDWSADMYASTDQLCYKFARNYDKSTNKEDQLEYLHTICAYLYYAKTYNQNTVKGERKATIISREQSSLGIRYCKDFVEKMSGETKKFQFFLANIYLYKAYFLMTFDNYVEAYYALEKSKQISKQGDLPRSVSTAHAALASLTGTLDLNDQAMAHYDSALAALKGVTTKKDWVEGQIVYIMYGRQLIFLTKHRKTGQKVWSDSVFSLHNQIKSPKHPFNDALESESNVALAALLYGQGKYKLAVARIDSAFRILPDLKRRGAWGDAMAYQALSMIRMGREKAGNAILEDLDFSKITNPVMVEVLEELYKHEIKRENFQKAIYYQNQLLDFVKRKALMDLQGKSLEIEKLFRLNQREQEIMDLQASKKRNTTVFAVVFALGFFLLLGLFIRNRANRQNTKKAIRQVTTMTALNLIQIEEARDMERKRLAKDLHDDFSASIAASLNYLQMLASKDHSENNRDQTSKVLMMLKDSYDRAREKSQNMYWEEHTDDFWKKTVDQVNILFSGTNMKIDIDSSIVGLILPIEVRKTILLVLKECIINIIKHAEATEVSILLYDEFGRLRLEITDNGKGIKDKSSQKSLGINSLRDRMETLGGDFQIFANDSKGTSVICTFPMNNDASENRA